MKLHFVVVNYNSGEWLSRALKSIGGVSNSFEWQVTVVDNASTDESMKIAQHNNPHPGIDWVFNEDNIGFAAANNQVLKESQADYVVLMNPDCELKDHSVDRIISVMDDLTDWGMAGCKIVNEDGSLQPTCKRRFPTPWSALVRMFLLDKIFRGFGKFQNFNYGDKVELDEQPHTVEAISGAFMVVRQPALREVGLLDEGYFMHCEDLDWCKRFSESSWKVGFVPHAVVEHAKGVSSQSRPIRVLWTLHKGMNRFFDKFYKNTYAWPIRYVVKIGIGVSFILRATSSYARSLFN